MMATQHAPTRLVVADRRDVRREVLRSAARVVGVTTVLILLYAFAPFDRSLHPRVVTELVVAVVLLGVVTVWEISRVARSPNPEVRAAEAIATALPLLLLPFATAYFVTARDVAGSFSQPLSKLDAAYFTLTTFTTVGYGDIAPVSEAARAIVMGQMVVDLVLIGVVVKLVFGAAKRRRDDISARREVNEDGRTPD